MSVLCDEKRARFKFLTKPFNNAGAGCMLSGKA